MIVKTIECKERTVQLIRQTLLPKQLEYLFIEDYQQMIDAIKVLDIRGAPAIGIATAYGLAIASTCDKNMDIAKLARVADQFKASRPTAVNLAWAVDRVMQRVEQERPATHELLCSLLWDEAERIHKEDRLLCASIGECGSTLISDGDTILTHCNAGALATGGIGTALGVIYTCRDQGKEIKVYVDETRPLLQGARLTAWELMQERIDVTLICDSVSATLMKQKKIDHVIVGADRIAGNGDVANKIGTYSLAVLANAHSIPFYVAAPYSTFDDSIKSGADIEIEVRPDEEVTCGFGKRTAPDGVKVHSPAFDITPAELISYYITDKGIKAGGRKN